MKHPHASIIKQWLEDMTQEIEIPVYIQNVEVHTAKATINDVISNVHDNCTFRIKPKPDEYEFLRQAIRDGKKIEQYSDYNKWTILNNPLFCDNVNTYRIHDEYRELKESQEQGKLIAFLHENGNYLTANGMGLDKFNFDNIPFEKERFKIVDHDIVEHAYIMMKGEKKPVIIKLTKYGIDGTIKADVIYENRR